jgi:GWxTD domain-containing protein
MRFNVLHSLSHAILAGTLFSASLLVAQAPSTPAADSGKPDAKAQDNSKSMTDKQRQKEAKKRWDEVSKGYKTWLEQDVRWIISGEEEAAFKLLATDEERDQFIEQFWLRRDPTPDTVENEFRDEHYRRIAYANEHFAAGIPGWKTDRGHIYIAWGPPDEIESHPSGGTYQRDYSEGGGSTSTYPFERWRYRYLEGLGNEVILEFVDSCMCGEYRLSIDPNEKDALLHTPNAGLTTSEEMGLTSKADRITGTNPTGQYGGSTNSSKQFDNLERMAKIMAPPPIKFTDLLEKVTSKIRYNLLPFDYRFDYVRITGDTVLVPITISVQNQNVTFVNKEGVQRASINILGRITTMTGRVVQTFEDTVGVDVPQSLFEKTLANSSVYWKAIPLRSTPNRYKLTIAVKDVNGDKVGTSEVGLELPRDFGDDNKLAASSLILADVMEKVSRSQIASGNFVIGDTKVRPRVPPANHQPISFKRDQRLNLWMQVYNLQADPTTKKTSASVTYEIVNMQSNKSVLKVDQKPEELGNVGDQFTIQKSMALNTLEPGIYNLKVTVNDNISKQTINPSARFMVQ